MIDIFSLAGHFKLLYRVPPKTWLLIMFAFLLLWTLLMLALRKKERLRWGLNLLLMLGGFCVILLVTFVRRGGGAHHLILVPLRPLLGMRTPGDYWQVTVMNLLVYVPFACGLTFCLAGRARHPVGTAILLCGMLSFAAEALQFGLGAGTAEVDDILMNTLGACISTLPYVAFTWCSGREKKGNY